MDKQKLKSLNEQFHVEELQQRLEYKVTKEGREDWYDGETTVTVRQTDPYTGQTFTYQQTVYNDW